MYFLTLRDRRLSSSSIPSPPAYSLHNIEARFVEKIDTSGRELLYLLTIQPDFQHLYSTTELPILLKGQGYFCLRFISISFSGGVGSCNGHIFYIYSFLF